MCVTMGKDPQQAVSQPEGPPPKIMENRHFHKAADIISGNLIPSSLGLHKSIRKHSTWFSSNLATSEILSKMVSTAHGEQTNHLRPFAVFRPTLRAAAHRVQ